MNWRHTVPLTVMCNRSGWAPFSRRLIVELSSTSASIESQVNASARTSSQDSTEFGRSPPSDLSNLNLSDSIDIGVRLITLSLADIYTRLCASVVVILQARALFRIALLLPL